MRVLRPAGRDGIKKTGRIFAVCFFKRNVNELYLSAFTDWRFRPVLPVRVQVQV